MSLFPRIKYFNPQNGFSLPEVMIVVLVLAIITTFSLMGLAGARSSLQLSNAGETLKTYLEKAISDAKRRHAQGTDRAKLQVISAKSYQVTIDFNGDGNLETRTIALPEQISFVYDSGKSPTEPERLARKCG